MRDNKLLTLLVFLLIGLFAVSGCDFTEPAALQDDETSLGEMRGPEYVEGELLVSIQEDRELTTYTAENQKSMIINEAEEHAEIMEEAGFEAESLFRRDENKLQISADLASRVAEEVGHINVVEFDTDRYKDLEKAKNGLAEILDSANIK